MVLDVRTALMHIGESTHVTVPTAPRNGRQYRTHGRRLRLPLILRRSRHGRHSTRELGRYVQAIRHTPPPLGILGDNAELIPLSTARPIVHAEGEGESAEEVVEADDDDEDAEVAADQTETASAPADTDTQQ